LGAITVALPNDDAREFLNPFGVWFANWIDGSWNSGGIWTAGYPQTYFFTTLFFYVALGLFITVGLLMRRVDMNRHFGKTSSDV